jgi:hypothetical protein
LDEFQKDYKGFFPLGKLPCGVRSVIIQWEGIWRIWACVSRIVPVQDVVGVYLLAV